MKVIALSFVFALIVVSYSQETILSSVPSLFNGILDSLQVSPLSGVLTPLLEFFGPIFSFFYQGFLSILFIILAFLWLGYKLLKLLFAPLNLVRQLGDVGYAEMSEQTQKQTANIVRKIRKIGEMPPVYPNGWFSLCHGSEVPKGTVTYVHGLGEHFAVFRGEDGRVSVLDAYCPHMGANLAIGGRVLGNCLECPFHGWQFRGEDGKCTKIPYAEKVPEQAKIKSWNCIECNDQILVWYHAEEMEPSWIPDEIEEIASGEWSCKGKTTHYINCHIEEIPENGADIAHLGQLHVPFIGGGTDLRYIFKKLWLMFPHKWTAQWEQREPPNEHVGRLLLTHQLCFYTWPVPLTKLDVTVDQVGPGIVILRFESFLGKGAFVQSLTPEGPMLQKLIHKMWVSKWYPTFVAKLFLTAEALQVDRDLMIWNNKTYKSKPLLVKEDHLIAKHRRWYSQFYSENSPKLEDLKGKDCEW